MKEFKDKVLCVTGAASGIGRAVALEGALRGMKVVINDIDAEGLTETEAMCKEYGVPVVSLAADISSAENVEALLNVCLDNFGKVNIMVANAGVTAPGPVWELPIQDINWISKCNFVSHTYAMHYFLKQMIKQGDECCYMNTASGAGLGISFSSCMYHATKTADVVQTECTYLALKSRGITNISMHVLCPAYIKTTIHLSDNHRPDWAAINDDPYYQSEEFIAGKIRAARGVSTGIPIDSVGLTVFTAFEEDQFYILTHPEALVVQQQRMKNVFELSHPGT
ncbi:MAG: SDR family NAD(P)-dependent oxidoreductase [Oscillospiraceae bacterium]|nr:SDR family NAD(P)-dependent oxidoreductase [Oscillospiraceae bacterium]